MIMMIIIIGELGLFVLLIFGYFVCISMRIVSYGGSLQLSWSYS